MKFGIAIDPFWALENVIDLVCHAESIGYESAWIPDQTFYADPFPILVAAGRQTKRINLGIGVTNPYTRSAIQVARTMATINELIGRPVALGIGAGNRRELLQPLGLEQDSPVARCREMVDIVRRLLQGDEITYHSPSAILNHVKLGIVPTNPIPIYIAARGPATLQLAGEVSDGVIIGDLLSDEGLEYAGSQIQIGIEKSGRKSSQVESVCWTTCFITNGEHRQVVEWLRPWIAHNLAASPVVVQQALGMDQARIELMRNTYQEKGPQAASHYVQPEDIDKLAIVGSPEKCAETVRRLEKRGINQLVLLLYSKDLSEVQENLNRFMQEVIPLI
jgi:5,10-methylenetetrahydromethanopterin reductase